jgi:guanine deaminase
MSNDNHSRWMGVAIEAAKRGIAAGQTPFGACIVRGGELLAEAHNQVWADTDITAHAEVVAIRRGCQKLGAVDLSGCVMYATAEPCPMCFGACHWARMERIVYGVDIATVAAAGFRELSVSNYELRQRGGSHLQIEAGVLRDQCAKLFELWLADPRHRGY